MILCPPPHTHTLLKVGAPVAPPFPTPLSSELFYSVETECDVADQQCANGLCVRTDQVCDGVNDCLDNTDEEVFCGG